MNCTQTPSLFKLTTTFHQPITKLQINRKQSLQIQKLPSTQKSSSFPTNAQNQQQSSVVQLNQMLSAYPMFQSPKNTHLLQTITSLNNITKQNDIKTSLFLKSYHQRLKRQRKRQQKLKSSTKNINLPKQQSRTTFTKDEQNDCKNNNDLYEMASTSRVHNINSKVNINNDGKQTKLSPIKLKKDNSLTRISLLKSERQKNKNIIKIKQKSSIGSQILVFKKSQFLDTSSTQVFKSNKKNYSIDSNLQLLLKEIHQIKQSQNKEIQKARSKQNCLKNTVYQNNPQINSKKNTLFLETFLTKFQRGFSLPTKRKSMSNNNFCQYGLQNSPRAIQNETTERFLPFRKKSNQKAKRIKLQKLYNFKSIDPWEIQHNKQHHFSHQPAYFTQNTQTLSN